MGVAKHTVDLRKVLVNLSEALLDNREPLQFETGVTTREPLRATAPGPPLA